MIGLKEKYHSFKIYTFEYQGAIIRNCIFPSVWYWSRQAWWPGRMHEEKSFLIEYCSHPSDFPVNKNIWIDSTQLLMGCAILQTCTTLIIFIYPIRSTAYLIQANVGNVCKYDAHIYFLHGGQGCMKQESSFRQNLF